MHKTPAGPAESPRRDASRQPRYLFFFGFLPNAGLANRLAWSRRGRPASAGWCPCRCFLSDPGAFSNFGGASPEALP